MMFNISHIRTLFLLLILSQSVSALPNSETSTIGATLSVDVKTSLEISEISISSSSFNAGDSVTFSLEMYNTGNTITEAESHVYIYDPGNNLVATINYANVTLAGGEIQTITKAWDSSGLSSGIYTAVGRADYNGTITNMENLTFTIFTPSYDNPDTTQYEVKEKEEVIIVVPPEEELEGANIEVIRSVFYKEVSKGENAIIFVLLENPTEEIVSARVSLDASGTPIKDDYSDILIPPNEKHSVTVPLRVPEDAPAGYYLLKINSLSGESEISSYLIVRIVPSSQDDRVPVLLREVSFDFESGKSIMALTITNKGNNPVEYVQVFEEMSPDLVSNTDELDFSTKPSKIYEDELMVRWDFENLLSDETRTITYTIPKIPYNTKNFIDWPSAQTVTIKSKSEKVIVFGELRTTSLLAGEEEDVVLDLFNSGSKSQTVYVTVLSPTGWGVKPSSFSVYIPSRESVETKFAVKAPGDAVPGSYAFTFRMTYEGVQDDASVFINVVEPVPEAEPLPGLKEHIWNWILNNQGNLFTGALGTLVVVAVAYLGYRRLHTPKYSEDRVESMKRIRKILE